MTRSVSWSGTGDDLESYQSRAIEAQKIVSRLRNETESMSAKDRNFLDSIGEELDMYGVDANITFPRLVWLRDIYEKVG